MLIAREVGKFQLGFLVAFSVGKVGGGRVHVAVGRLHAGGGNLGAVCHQLSGGGRVSGQRSHLFGAHLLQLRGAIQCWLQLALNQFAC